MTLDLKWKEDGLLRGQDQEEYRKSVRDKSNGENITILYTLWHGV